MSASDPLLAVTARLTELQDTLTRVTVLITRLHRLHPAQDAISTSLVPAASGQDVDVLRADLSADIHETLKQTEEDMELLQLEMGDVEPSFVKGRRSSGRANTTGIGRYGGEAAQAGSSLLANVERTAEDIRIARTQFRAAQLSERRAASAAAERERVQYLSDLRAAADATGTATSSASGDTATANAAPEPSHSAMRNSLLRPGNRRTAQSSQLKPEDQVLSASTSLTTSLRRTHAILSASVSSSQFASQTLAESNAALAELNKSYTSLDDLLSRSRGLLGSLISSQKSDTWYLETCCYILLATITWLVFRRLLYGPLWVILWIPLRILSGMVAGIYGLIAGGASASRALASSASSMRPPLKVMPSASGRGAAQVPGGAAPRYMPAGAGGAGAKGNHGELDGEISRLVSNMAEASEAMAFATASVSAVDDTAAAGSEGDADDSTQDAQGQGRDQPRDVQGQARDQPRHVHGQAGDEGDAAVRRGDGTVLRERDAATEPRNPKKRMWEEPPEQQRQREL